SVEYTGITLGGRQNGVSLGHKRFVRHFLHTVNQPDERILLGVVEPQVAGEQLVYQLAAADMNSVHVALGAVALHDLVGQHDDFVVGFNPLNPEEVEVGLPEFAQTSALGALVAPHVGRVVPAHRVRQFLPLGGHHTADRWCHFGANGYATAATIRK